MDPSLFVDEVSKQRAKLAARGWHRIAHNGEEVLWQPPQGRTMPEHEAFALLARMDKANTKPDAEV